MPIFYLNYCFVWYVYSIEKEIESSEVRYVSNEKEVEALMKQHKEWEIEIEKLKFEIEKKDRERERHRDILSYTNQKVGTP